MGLPIPPLLLAVFLSDLDQGRRSDGPDLGSNMQMVSAGDAIL